MAADLPLFDVRQIPWQINVELRMTLEDARSLYAVLDSEKHSLLREALGLQISDFEAHGFTRGILVLGLANV